MKKLFKSASVILAALLFMPNLMAKEAEEITTVYLSSNNSMEIEYIANQKPVLVGFVDNDQYAVTLEKICQKDSEICFTSDETVNEELSEAGNLLTKYETGKTYTYSIVLTAKEGYTFTEESDLGFYMNKDYKLNATSETLTIDDFYVGKLLK